MGKRRVTPGTGQLNLEIELSLLNRLRDFASERDEKIRHVIEMAICRHLDYPPPLPAPPVIPPLPPVTNFERKPRALTTTKTKSTRKTK